MALIDKDQVKAEIRRRLSLIYLLEGDFTDGSRDAYEGLLSWLDTLPEQPELKPKAIVIRPAVNLQKELMGVSDEVKDAVMLLLKEGWSLKAPDSEREFDQRAVCAGISSIPPKFKLDVKPEQPVEGLDAEMFKEWGTTKEEYLAKSMDKVHLEMEIATYLQDWEDDDETGLHLSTDEECMPIELEGVRDLARHFAEWGEKNAYKAVMKKADEVRDKRFDTDYEVKIEPAAGFDLGCVNVYHEGKLVGQYVEPKEEIKI